MNKCAFNNKKIRKKNEKYKNSNNNNIYCKIEN